MVMRTTFVSTFMTIYDQPYQNKDLSWRFRHFKKLCQTGIPLAVFCSRDCLDYFQKEILAVYSNVVLLESLDLKETWTYQTYQKVVDDGIDVELPNTRTVEKDTKEYLLLMNSKTELVVKAVEKNPFQSTHFAWIDFNIFHIFGGKEEYVTNFLQMLSERTLADRFLTLPGCWGKDRVLENYLMNDICWRFCGGFFIGSVGRMREFHEDYIRHFENFLRQKRKLVWEVNFWAYIELHHGLSVIWFQGDHNETILEFNAEYMSFTMSSLPSCSRIRYEYPDYGDYIPTSTSYVCHKGNHIINTRIVNYWLYPNGAYHIKDPQGHIRTRNICSRIDETSLLPLDYNEIVVKEGELQCHGGSIYGLEDIRLYTNAAGELGFIASSINYSGMGRNRMVRGVYDMDNGRFRDCVVLIPPDPNSWCEKNWIPLIHKGVEHFIYRWSPFEVGVIKKMPDGEQLVITTRWEHNLPMFSKIRGSTPFIDVEDGLLGVVHFSYEGSPRRYFHMLILLDKDTMLPIKYSDYFVFNKVSIEFCIGFMKRSDHYYFWVSNFDRDPEVFCREPTVPLRPLPCREPTVPLRPLPSL